MLRSQVSRTIGCYIIFIALILAFPLREAVSAALESDREANARSVFHYLMGLIHEWDGESEEAIAEYRKAEKADGESYLIYLKIGSNFARAGKFPEAIKELNKAAELNPEDLQAHYILAIVYSSQQDFDKAALEYEIILKFYSKTDPKNTEIHNYLGQLYYSQKKYDKATEEFSYVLSLEPKNADVMFMLGSLSLDQGDRQKAGEYFQKTLEIDPEYENALNSLGYMYAEDGIKLDEAKAMIEKAIEMDPDNGAYVDSLGWVYYKKGMYQEALEQLTKAITLYKDAVIYDHLGDVYQKMNEIENAEKSWKQSLELLPEQESVEKKLEELQVLKKDQHVLR